MNVVDSQGASARRLFEFDENGGPFTVGLKVVEQYDYSRVFRSLTDALGQRHSDERARPLQTLIWYPADSAEIEPMTVGDYIRLWDAETSFGRPATPARAKEWLSGIGAMVASTLTAKRDAPPAVGRFPAVIYAPGFSNPSWENADLCEYLASHGYVVAATASIGEMSRDMTPDVTGINAQARDISFLVGYVGKLANVDQARIAVIGYSWGGLSNVFAAARDNRIGALVALDGSLRFSPGLVRQTADVHPDRMTIPLLSIVQGQWTPEEQSAHFDRYPEHRGPSVMNAWTHGDLTTVRLLGLSHMEHCSMYQRNEEVWWKLLNVYGQKKADYGREDGIRGYAWIARYTVAFLDAYLRDIPEASAFLKRTPVENGVPPHVMVANHRAAVRQATSVECFRAELGRQGFDHLTQIWATFREQDPDFTIAEWALHSWSEELIDQGALWQALALREFNVQLHSESSDACTSLADVQYRLGRFELAMGNYRKALERDPMNADALWKLKGYSGTGG